MYGFKILCEGLKFQRAPLKFHTKFWTHTPQNMHFIVFNLYVIVTISLNCDITSLSETGPSAVFMKIIRHVGHFRWLGPNVWWEISHIWLQYVQPIRQNDCLMNHDSFSVIVYTVSVFQYLNNRRCIAHIGLPTLMSVASDPLNGALPLDNQWYWFCWYFFNMV